MFEIREANAGDCRGLAEVQVDSYRTAYAGSFPESYLERFSYEEQEQDWLDLLTAGQDDVLLVAVPDDGNVVGYALARAEPHIYPGYDAEILAVHVRQPYRRRGVGTALLGKTIEKLEERGCRSAMLWTLSGSPIRQWYERLQGKVIDEKSYQVDDWEIVEIAYGWEAMPTLLSRNRSTGSGE